MKKKLIENLPPEPPLLVIDWKVLENVINTIGRNRAESGGAIGGKEDQDIVTHYYFDKSSHNSTATYSPDYKLLNNMFKKEWNPTEVRLRGFIHSHPGKLGRPSNGDMSYASRILKSIPDLRYLWLPIINTIPDTGQFKLTPWAAFMEETGVSIIKGKIQVLNAPADFTMKICGESVLETIKAGKVLDEIVIGKTKQPKKFGVGHTARTVKKKTETICNGKQDKEKTEQAKTIKIKQSEIANNGRIMFNRVEEAYDLVLMNHSRIIAVGAGGAASWLEELARAGVGQFVLIDPDIVTETNLATQQTYRKDIGRPKVHCIAERISDINPAAVIIPIQNILDDLADNDVQRLALDKIDGHIAYKTVICGLTDEFSAQARVNRLALQIGLPSLCAQVYKEGRGAEITFTYPGMTPACHRCILSSRYRYFLEQGQKNDVTSHGTPIFSTTRLNALKGFLMLAILHHGSDHPRWGNMLQRIGKRNLIQVRIDPDFAETMGMTVFNRVFEKADKDRLFFDEVVWLPQDHEGPDTGYPTCPDCGGTGDLRNAIGRLKKTNLIPQTRAKKAMERSVANVNIRQIVKAYK